jgi:hypothetical protein
MLSKYALGQTWINWAIGIRVAKTLNRIIFLMRCKSLGIVPKGLSVKMPYSGRRSFKIAQRASVALLRDRIHAHWNNKSSQLEQTVY